MRIPLLMNRGRAERASPAELSTRSKHIFRFQATPRFRNPLSHPARVAVLGQTFTGNNLRVFSPAQFSQISDFEPQILAGTLINLRDLSQFVTASRAIVVFTNSCSSPLLAANRDWLWQRFAVPCFEQLLDARGQVIAEECQVHAGLHVLQVGAVSGMLTSAECDCGRTEPRLV